MTYENNTEAIKAFTRAIELNDIIANAYANRGLSHHRLKEYGLAIADYQKAESLLPGLSSYNMACAYSLLGKSDDAFQWLTVCQKSDYKQSKEILLSDTDFENIRSDARWKKIIDTDWSTPYDKAIQEIDVKYIAKDIAGAIEQCVKASALAPAKTKPYLIQSLIYPNNLEWDKAVASLDKAMTINPKDWEVYASKATLLYRQKKYDEAIGFYEQAMALNPEYSPQFDLAMAKFAVGKPEEALKNLKLQIEFYPRDDFAIYFAGFLSYNLKEDAAAMSYVNRALEMNPEMPDYHLLKANIYLVAKDYANAIAGYTKALELNPKLAEGYYKRALAKAERYAKTYDKQDKKDFCSDMEKAEGLNYPGAAQYLRELCN
jgi:tetratricopeptide (TPR) repeat protein